MIHLPARQAVAHGTSAIVVSNHGGRQLDRAGLDAWFLSPE